MHDLKFRNGFPIVFGSAKAVRVTLLIAGALLAALVSLIQLRKECGEKPLMECVREAIGLAPATKRKAPDNAAPGATKKPTWPF